MNSGSVDREAAKRTVRFMMKMLQHTEGAATADFTEEQIDALTELQLGWSVWAFEVSPVPWPDKEYELACVGLGLALNRAAQPEYAHLLAKLNPRLMVKPYDEASTRGGDDAHT